jgi:transposase
MKSNDFLGFMSNLVNCLKLGRNTSFDKIPLLEVFLQKEQVSIPVNQREVVFIMDNARIHVAKLVKKKLLQNYNILFLAPYSPYLNIIELWFSQLKKQAC